MNVAVALALLLQGPQDPMSRISAIIDEASCARFDELRTLYLALERPPARSSLRPEQHRQVAIFFAYCGQVSASAPNGPAIKTSFLANSGAYQQELDLSRAINTVLALPDLLTAHFTASSDLQVALRRTRQLLLLLQVWRTEGVFGPDWYEKQAAIAAKPPAQRTLEETEFHQALETWRNATFLP